MFGAVALVGAVGAASMTVMKGPVRAMSEVTKRTIAENNMIASGKLSIIAASNADNNGDCDGDNTVEPIQFTPVSAPDRFPAGGGHLPPDIGASLQDPWKTNYGYCVWDHGSDRTNSGAKCIHPLAANNRLEGENAPTTQMSLTIISAGPDRIFQTSCTSYNPGPGGVNKPSGSDDLVLKYSYTEAAAAGGGLWNIKSGSPEVAEIGGKDIEIVGSSGATAAKIGYDAGLGQSGVGEFLAVKTNDLYSKTGSVPVTLGDSLKLVDGGTCNAANIDGLQFATGTKELQYCDGTPGGWQPAGGGAGSEIIDADGDTKIQVDDGADDDTIRFDTAGTEKMIIDPTGKVGVGVASPAETIHTAGNIRADGRTLYLGAAQTLIGNNGQRLYYDSNHTSQTQLIMRDVNDIRHGSLFGNSSGANFGLLDGDGNWSYLAAKDSYTAFRINNSEKMRITSAGNVGIATSSPKASYKLHVNGAILNESTGFTMHNTSAPATKQVWGHVINNGSGTYNLGYRTDDTPVPGGLTAAPLIMFPGSPGGSLVLDASGRIRLSNTGASVNEFSTDTTLNGNSNNAVPTERAVKTYVDAQIAAAGGGGITVQFTSATYKGNLGGLRGANAKCQSQFPGSYFCPVNDFLRSGRTSGTGWVAGTGSRYFGSSGYSAREACDAWNTTHSGSYGSTTSGMSSCYSYRALACCTRQ